MNSSTIGTTNIDSLPISPQSGNGGQGQPVNNVRLDTFEKPPQYNPNNLNGNSNGQGTNNGGANNSSANSMGPNSMGPNSTANSMGPNNVVIDNPAQTLQQQRADDPAVMQRNMNQFVTGLQQASASGLLSLSARDIPQSQEHLARDQQMQPNYIPQSGGSPDYINEYASQQSLEEIAQTQGFKEQRAKRANDWYEELQVPILLAVLYFLFQLPAFRLRMLAFMPSLFQKDGNPNLTGYVVNSIFFGGLYLALKNGMRYFAL